MPFLLLLVLAVACLLQLWPPPPGAAPVWVWAGLSWLPVVGVLGATFVITSWARRQFLQNGVSRETVLRRYGALRSYQIFVLIGAYALTLYAFGWGWVVGQLCTVGEGQQAALAPGAELVLLAPFLIGLLLSWCCYYDVERAIHDVALPLFHPRAYWSRWSYVSFHARQNLALVVAPLFLLLIGQAVRHQFPEWEDNEHFQLAAFGLLLGVFASMPWILRLVLGLRSLPAGPLRDRLMTAARRLRFRCSDILLWNTNGGVANAMVVGVFPVPRYVILSDRLLTGLSDDEVEAVFGHEVGHVKHHHIAYYLGFLLISLGVLAGTWRLIAGQLAEQIPGLREYLEPSFDGAQLPLLPMIGLYIFVVFGFLSRRCERQADIFGCRAVSCERCDCPGHTADVQLLPLGRGLCPTGIRTFIQALEKVANLNGISRSKPGWLQSWQHSTIARRVEFLQNMLADPAIEPHFQKRVRRVKWALLLGLGTVFVILFVTQG
jgi:Zn-dependent protease with chaperone function